MRSINLLPPEAAERSKARRRILALAAVGVVYLGLLALLAFWQFGNAADAEQEVALQEQENDALQRQISELASVERLRSTYNDGIKDMETVLRADIAWGSLLTDLGRQLPDRTWLTTLQAQAQTSDTEPARFGDLTVAGTAFDYPDTASFLRAFDDEAWPAVGGAWLPSAQEGHIGAVPVVNFSGVAGLTIEALSDRIERLPEVPE